MITRNVGKSWRKSLAETVAGGVPPNHGEFDSIHSFGTMNERLENGGSYGAERTMPPLGSFKPKDA
jgi:hypothetical protein